MFLYLYYEGYGSESQDEGQNGFLFAMLLNRFAWHRVFKNDLSRFVSEDVMIVTNRIQLMGAKLKKINSYPGSGIYSAICRMMIRQFTVVGRPFRVHYGLFSEQILPIFAPIDGPSKVGLKARCANVKVCFRNLVRFYL